MLSSPGVSLSLFVSKDAIAVPNRKDSALALDENLIFCELSTGNIAWTDVFAMLFLLHKAHITFIFICVFSLLSDPEYLVSANVLSHI